MFISNTIDRMPRLSPLPGGPLVAEPKPAHRTAQADRAATARPSHNLTGTAMTDATGMGAALRPQHASAVSDKDGEYTRFVQLARTAKSNLMTAQAMVWADPSVARIYATLAHGNLNVAASAEAPPAATRAARDGLNAVTRALIHLSMASGGDEAAKALANHELHFAGARVQSAIGEAERGR